MAREAMFYTQEESGTVICTLCNHRCHIRPGKRGICGVRENREGTLVSLVYGRLIAENTDPIEKKPLFHFLPGSRSYSISTVGCNFQCLHCQNYEISQYPHRYGGAIEGRDRSARDVVAEAVRSGCESMSYTYVEPTIFYEFSRDCAVEAHRRGIKNVYVTNGYMSREVVADIAPFLDGANIDVKSFQESFYRKVCKARLQPVLDNVRYMFELGIWVEVTTLIIPGLNDSDEELRDIAEFIHDISPAIPWHVTAFHPTYKMTDRNRTPQELLQKAWMIGRESGLHFVYQGNIPGHGEDTFCPQCGETVIGRYGFSLQNKRLDGGRCGTCKAEVAGVWG